MSESGPPLRKYSLRDPHGGGAVSAMLEKEFPGHLLELAPGRKDIRGQFGLCPLTGIQLFYGRHECASRFQAPYSRHFMQSFPIQGTSETVNNAIAMTTTSLVVREKGLLRSDGVGGDGGDGLSR